MNARFLALPSDAVRRLRDGAADANGRLPERSISNGKGNPCRHCLAEIRAGAPMLILAWRPFTTLQPYAETGPIFLCEDSCQRYPQDAGPPPLYRERDMLIRGYDRNERIIYGTGGTVPMRRLDEALAGLFSRPGLDFIHARSPTNNCYHFRIERDTAGNPGL